MKSASISGTRGTRALWRDLILLFCILSPSILFTQTRPGLISFKRLAIPEDVPATLISELEQDRDGFLWLGTQEGLVRYDGYRFKVFHMNPDDPATIGGAYIRAITEASDGRIWAGTFSGGLSIYDPKTDQFKRYRHQEGDINSLINDRVESIAEDPDGYFWIATPGGLDRMDPRTDTFTHFKHQSEDPGSIAHNRVSGLLADHRGTIWVGTADGLQVWDRNSGKFRKRVSTPGEPGSFAGQYINFIFEDSRHNIWLSTFGNGAGVLDPKTDRVTRFNHDPDSPTGLSYGFVYEVAQLNQREIWIATYGGGIDVVDPVTLKVVDRLKYDAANQSTIGNNRIGALQLDKSGLMWVGSWGGGLAFHDPTNRAFRIFRHSPGNPRGISHPSIVRTLETTDGTIWLGTNGNGIDIMDENGFVMDGFRPKAEDPGALAHGSITCMAQDGSGTIWIGTLDGVLHRLAHGSRRFERITQKPGLPSGAIRAMTFDREGNIWVGSRGMARVSPDGKTIISYYHRDDDPESLSGLTVESLAFTGDGTLWVGTEYGLNAFDTETGRARHILRDPQNKKSLPNNWISDLMVDRNGRLWVSSQGGAAVLKHWDGTQAVFDNISNLTGRLPGPVYSLIEDNMGKVWLGGKLRVNPTDWSYETFGPAEGNEFHNFFIASRVKTRNGTLLFGAPGGLLMVNPGKISPWTFEPRVQVSSVSLDGEKKAGAVHTRQLELVPGQSNIRLEFTSLDLSAPQKLIYRYRLEDYDTGWIQADASQRSASYTRLPPGKYRLRIQGTNRTGQWSSHEVSVDINVYPTFYQTTLFRLFLAGIGALVVFGGYRLRVRWLEARSRYLEQLVTERTEELNDANVQLALKNENITDSIRYAQTIQSAILPLPEEMERSLEDHFILFKPKDIVSGDFYWMSETTESVLFAVVDCTGHGVPGAFMSMIGFELLNEIVQEKHILKPAEILEMLNQRVRNALKQKDERTRTMDGMDVCLCCLEKKGNCLTFAGARRSLYLVRKKDRPKPELVEIKGTRRSIGGRQKEKTRRFKQTEILLHPGDILYLSSDGFVDQSDTQGVKFGSKRFKALLTEICREPMYHQLRQLSQELSLHMKDEEQRDDITVMAKLYKPA